MDLTSIKKRRPFHEVVVEVIAVASNAELECLAGIIKATKIPKGHDDIIAAWNTRREEMCWGNVDLGVPADLNLQKQEIAEAQKTKNGQESAVGGA